jgi:DNA repair exonuclease SbcCD ATPase subunit
MTTTTASSASGRGSSVCMDDASAAQVARHQQSCCSGCACPTCCSGRTIRWQQVVSLSGVAFDVALLAIALFKIHTVWGYVITAGGSGACHVFSTISLYIWQPRRALEKDIEMAGDVEKKVGDEAAGMQQEIVRLQQLLEQQEKLLKDEQAFSKDFKQQTDAKVAQIRKLSEDLDKSRAELEEVRQVSESWKSCTKEFRKIIGSIDSNRIGEDVESLTEQIERLRSAQITLTKEVKQQDEQAAGVQKVHKCWGEMLEQVNKAFEGLSTDLKAKKSLLAEASSEIEKLGQEVAKLKAIQLDFTSLKEKSTTLAIQLEQANNLLRKYEPVLRNPQFAEALKKNTSS